MSFYVILLAFLLTELDSLSHFVNGQDSEGPHIRSVPSKTTLHKLNCILSQCEGKSGEALEQCSMRCGQTMAVSARSPPDARSACSAPQCRQYDGVYRSLCEFTKCTLDEVDSKKRIISPMAEKRYDFDEIMWPDMFETRSSEESRGPSRSRRESREELSLSRERKDVEQGRPVHAQGCSTTCHGFSGKDYDHCMSTQCKGNNAPIALKKRWSTRLCMETHCQGMGNKVEYFMCGKLNCH